MTLALAGISLVLLVIGVLVTLGVVSRSCHGSFFPPAMECDFGSVARDVNKAAREEAMKSIDNACKEDGTLYAPGESIKNLFSCDESAIEGAKKIDPVERIIPDTELPDGIVQC